MKTTEIISYFPWLLYYCSTGFSGAYCRISGDAQITIDQSFLQGYKSVLTSKHSEETMVGENKTKQKSLSLAWIAR